jgi:pyrroline-5-carboxylate reductase
MGSAILSGLLDALDEIKSGDARTWNFTACTKTERSAATLVEKLGQHATRVQVLHGQNEEALADVDVVILGVKPYLAKEILSKPGIGQALAGKLVISLMAGVSVDEVHDLLLPLATEAPNAATYVVKAIPTIAARYRQSMTLIERSSSPLPQHHEELLTSIFNFVGSVKVLEPDLMDVGSVLVTACLATLTVPLDGLLDGSVIEGLPRRDAMELMSQGIAGLGALLKHGGHPAMLRESISSPRGVTIQTLLSVERENTRVTFTDALLHGTEYLQKMRSKAGARQPSEKDKA